MTSIERRAEIEYRTEERLGILVDSGIPTLKQTFEAKQAAIAEVAELEFRHTDLKPIKSLLEQIYGARAWQYAEDCLLLDIIRSIDALTEAQAIVSHYNAMPAQTRIYFPQSAFSLLSNWHQTLDRVRMAKNTLEKPSVSLTAQKKAIEELMKNHPGNPESTSYERDPQDRQEFKELKSKLSTVNRAIAGL